MWVHKKMKTSEEIFQNKRTKNRCSNIDYNISVILISKCRIQKRLKHGSKVVGNCRGTIPSLEVSVLEGGGRTGPTPTLEQR